MAKMTVRQICDKAIENSQPFLGDATKLSEYSFMEEYLNDFENFDTDISENYGFLYPRTEKPTLEETLAFFRKRSTFMIKKHSKELDNLWKIANTTFDPAYNVEEHIIEDVKKTGSDTLRDAIDSVTQTDNLGARKNTSLYGEQQQTQNVGSQTSSVQYGEQSQTQNIGAQTSSVEYGEQSQSQTTGAQSSSVEYGAKQSAGEEEKAAFNSLDYQKNISTSQSENAHTDSTSTGARTDSTTTTSHTDTTSNGERTDTNTSSSHTDTTNAGERIDSSTLSAHTDEMTSDAVVDTHTTDYREDVHEQTYDNTVSRKYDRQGNVGTMSTPELLQKAADSVAVFDFYNKLYEIVLGELTYYFDEGIEAF